MRPYRVPDAVKPEVDRQIQDLLNKGLIRPSDSPMASPIVCVAKKDGGVRIACDYRYLNPYTVGDACPMTTIDEVLRNLARLVSVACFHYVCVHFVFINCIMHVRIIVCI